MKKQKRCIVVAQGFYEWLKKNNCKEKIPHFIRRKDKQLMCFAGLWDCVQFEGKFCASWTPTAASQQTSVVEPAYPGSRSAYYVFHALCTCCGRD